VLDDHRVLASVGSVGDAYDNALAESFVDSFKTELIADRVWRSRSQLELAVVGYIGWFNHQRLHEALGDIPPAELEQLHHARRTPILGNGSLAGVVPRAADALATRRFSTRGVDFAANGQVTPENAIADQAWFRSGRAEERSRDERLRPALAALRSEDPRSSRR
jgi:Integrase core domain